MTDTDQERDHAAHIEKLVRMLRTSYNELADARIHRIETYARHSTKEQINEANSRYARWAHAVEDDASNLADALATRPKEV